MFIKLHFIPSVGNDAPTMRIIKVSRIQEVRHSNYKDGASVQLAGDKEFRRVVESVDYIFGIVKK